MISEKHLVLRKDPDPCLICHSQKSRLDPGTVSTFSSDYRVDFQPTRNWCFTLPRWPPADETSIVAR
jgi:hypothetical protein